jgi:diacylglycerol kinase (ATP)
VLRNARAGHGRKQPPSRELEKRLGARGALRETSSLSELDGVAYELARKPPKVLVLWGGDGTITNSLSALLRAFGERPLPPVCLLPGGTMNVVSRSLGVKGRPEQAFARLVARRADDALPTLTRTIIRVGERAGFLFGVGLLVHFLEALYDGGRSGLWASLSTLGRGVTQAVFGRGELLRRLFTPFRARITLDGVAWPEAEFVNASAGAVPALGLGFSPYIRAAEREGAFHLIAHNLTPLKTALELPRIRLGRGMKRVSQDITSHVVIETDKKLRYSLDGDFFEAQDRFELRGGTSLRLIVP